LRSSRSCCAGSSRYQSSSTCIRSLRRRPRSPLSSSSISRAEQPQAAQRSGVARQRRRRPWARARWRRGCRRWWRA
jgi:hypothetical protein